MKERIYVKIIVKSFKIYKQGSIGNFYNIGSGNILKNKLLVLKLVKLAKVNKYCKNVKIKFVKDRPGHDTRYSLDSSKL